MSRKMTVKELIAILKTYPENASVSAYYSLFVNDKEIELWIVK